MKTSFFGNKTVLLSMLIEGLQFLLIPPEHRPQPPSLPVIDHAIPPSMDQQDRRSNRVCLVEQGNPFEEFGVLKGSGRCLYTIQIVYKQRPDPFPLQSWWKTMFRSRLTGLLSGLDGMTSPICFHQRWHTSVRAIAAQRASSSIST